MNALRRSYLIWSAPVMTWLLNGGFRPADSTIPWCCNRFDRNQYTPNSDPEYSNVLVTNNGVRVKVIMENTNSNGLENRVSGVVFIEELERRGLGDLVELRFYNDKLHAKPTLIDDSLLIIGSQNMHYSSWSDIGLAEHSLTTNDLDAIAEYQALFESKWQETIPFEEAEFSSSP